MKKAHESGGICWWKGNLCWEQENASESFQLCAISINDTVNIHVLLSVKLSMFHSPNRFIHFLSFLLTEIAHISSLNFLLAHIFTAHWTIECEKGIQQNFACMNERRGYIDKWFLAFYPFQWICNNRIFTSSAIASDDQPIYHLSIYRLEAMIWHSIVYSSPFLPPPSTMSLSEYE